MKKLNVRDLINAGLFSIIMVFLGALSGVIGAVPFLYPAIPFILGIVMGPVYMLYSTKIKSFGMVLIMAVIIGIVVAASGHSIYVLPFASFAALLAEFILKKGNYQSLNHARWSYTVFGIYNIGFFIPIFFQRAAYIAARTAKGADPYRTNIYLSLTPSWSFIPMVLMGCLGCYIGCTIGIKLLNKHFKKAGMV